jgi:beta-glucosidase
MHHLMLAHGRAVKTIKSINSNLQVGLSNAIWKIDSLKKISSSHFAKAEALLNRSFMDPVFKGHYPKEFNLLFKLFYRQKTDLADDLKVISHPIDFIGVNHYSRLLIEKTWVPFIPFKIIKPRKDSNKTHMGWEIVPKAFSEILKWISVEYNNPAIYITENGAAFPDKIEKGNINDNERIKYLNEYIINLGQSISEGINIKGYFVWSLLDNFEWENGFTKRFGIVYVDFINQQRIIKKSGYWYKNLLEKNSINY